MVRHVKYPPYFYGVILNEYVIKDPTLTDVEKKFNLKYKLLKVGFTQQETGSTKNTRMKAVREDIERRGWKSSVLFVLKKPVIDNTKNKESEDEFRKTWGFPVSKTFAEEYDLPVKTEWVLTTQAFVDRIIAHKNKIKKSNRKMYADDLKELAFDKAKGGPEIFSDIIGRVSG